MGTRTAQARINRPLFAVWNGRNPMWAPPERPPVEPVIVAPRLVCVNGTCGDTIPPGRRSDARYCSERCRHEAASRRRRKRERAATAARRVEAERRALEEGRVCQRGHPMTEENRYLNGRSRYTGEQRYSCRLCRVRHRAGMQA